jgi:predicted acyl esterase
MENEKPDLKYIAKRLKNFIFPPIRVLPFPPGIVINTDVAITVRDGTILRANIFRPEKEGQFPVVMCAHPYGKDKFNRKGWLGVRPLFQFRILNQPEPLAVSAWASWEAPDPAFWVPKGYVVINIDLRGFFTSEGQGQGEVLSDQEAQDYYDCIEWAAVQPWSSGKVGLNGVSYLAISQYKVAALNPPHLAAICPWEGFSDFYKDLAYPGGIREDGFTKMWGSRVGSRTNIRQEQLKRPLRDAWYQSVVADLKQITVPSLICGSFSDQSLHTHGSFRVFKEISSPHKWLYTHRSGKWAAYYSPEALAFQLKFFDHFLRDEPNDMLEVAPVRLEVRDTGKTIHKVRLEQSYPPAATHWLPLYLNGETGQLSEEPAENRQTTSFALEKGPATFEWNVPDDLEISGQPVLKLYVELKGATDLNLFAGIRKIRADRQVVFEGSYGYGYDLVTKGWQKASLRKLDPQKSQPHQPEHAFLDRQPVGPAEIVELEFALMPSATFFKQGDRLRLDLQGHWFTGKNPIIYGPARYEASPKGLCTIYSGAEYTSRLLLPVSPAQDRLD